jgi:hypothetical protein
MSTYIPLGKIPQTLEERQELLAKRAEMEDRQEASQLTHVQRRVVDFLLNEKGYLRDEIKTNAVFKVELPDSCFEVKADIAVNLNDKFIFVIKCIMSSIESWERHAIAFGRVAAPYQIPYAIVTDGDDAKIIDVIKGKSVSAGLDAIPSKSDLLNMLKETAFAPYPPERTDREKMILHAFDAITCSTTIASEK